MKDFADLNWLEWLCLFAWVACALGIIWYIFKLRRDNED